MHFWGGTLVTRQRVAEQAAAIEEQKARNRQLLISMRSTKEARQRLKTMERSLEIYRLDLERMSRSSAWVSVLEGFGGILLLLLLRKKAPSNAFTPTDELLII